MSDHSPRLPQPTRSILPIYPPAWYADLVELRSRLKEETGPDAATGMHSVENADPANAVAQRECTGKMLLPSIRQRDAFRVRKILANRRL